MADRLRMVHLSDTHLSGDGTRHYGVVDTLAALRRVLRRLDTVGQVDVLVASGDLSDDGSEASYRLLQGELEPWAADHGAEVLYAMGNHDVHAGFEAVLGATTGMTMIAGVRFLRLDSVVPGAGYGKLGAAPLDWLRGELATPAPNGTVVVLHHPPVAARTALLKVLELQRPSELLDVLSDTDTRLVLAGHYHHPLATTARGIPVVVAPAVANTNDVLAPAGHERAVIGSAAAIVDLPLGDAHGELSSPSVTLVTAPTPDDGTEVFDLSPEKVSEITAQAGPPG